MGLFAANWLVERINRAYVQEAAGRYGRGRVLDAGCGNGWAVRWLEDKAREKNLMASLFSKNM